MTGRSIRRAECLWFLLLTAFLAGPLHGREEGSSTRIIETTTAQVPVPAGEERAVITAPAFVVSGRSSASDPSSDEPLRHLWAVLHENPGRYRVLHRTSADAAGGLHPAFEGIGRATAAAAYGDRLFVVWSDGSVQSCRFVPAVSPQPPAYRVEQWPPLPPGTVVAAVDADSLDLLVFAERSSGTDASEPVLLRREGLGWTAVAIPDDLDADRVMAVVTLDPAGEEPALVLRTDAGGTVVRRSPDGAWNRAVYPGPVGPNARFLRIERLGTSSLLLAEPEPARGLRIDLLRSGTLRTIGYIAEFDPDRPWWVVADEDRIELIQPTPAGLRRSGIAFPDGTPAETATFVEEPRKVKVNPLAMMVIGAIALAMMTLLLSGRRDPSLVIPDLPPGTRLGGIHRLIAAAVDLAPPLAFSIVFYGLDPREILMRWAEQPADWDSVAPAATVIGLHAAHTFLSELFTASTLGKALCGCRVVNFKGEPPHLWQILARNLLKMVELAAPLLLTLPLISTYQQRLGDLVARTVVVSTWKPRPMRKPDSDDSTSD